MKATRKLIPAIAMLLISAVMMSTATFAWFSTNTSVTAGGMAIQAKSETIFLQIVNGNGTFDDDADQVNATKALRPPRYLLLRRSAVLLDRGHVRRRI